MDQKSSPHSRQLEEEKARQKSQIEERIADLENELKITEEIKRERDYLQKQYDELLQKVSQQKQSTKSPIGGLGERTSISAITMPLTSPSTSEVKETRRHSPHPTSNATSTASIGPLTTGTAKLATSQTQMMSVLPTTETTLQSKAAKEFLTKDTQTEECRPIGVFWDYENLRIPQKKSGMAFVQKIRTLFYNNNTEGQFTMICDVNEENKEMLDEINLSQIEVLYVNAIAKNSVDEKLKQSIRRFMLAYGDKHPILILITSDINFSTDLCDFKYRYKAQIILIHEKVSDALKNCAHKTYKFTDIISNLPQRKILKQKPYELVIRSLPQELVVDAIKEHLLQLTENLKGKVIKLSQEEAVMSFPTMEAAKRSTSYTSTLLPKTALMKS